MKPITKRILALVGIIAAFVCLGVVPGMPLAGSGAKAKSQIERDGLPEVSHSPLFKASLANDIERMDGKSSVTSGTALQDSKMQAQGGRNFDTYTPTLSGCPTTGYSCGATCGSTCSSTCLSCPTTGTTCLSCPTMGSTCEATCRDTCASDTCITTICGSTCSNQTCGGSNTCGSNCRGPSTVDTTCGSACGTTTDTTCGSTCSGTTCSSDCEVPPKTTTTTSRTWAHDSIGVSTGSTDWYLAEGCTGEGFETWVLVQNPGNTPATIQLTYMTPEGAKPGPSQKLPAKSRKTFNVADTVPGVWEVSTKVHSDKNVVAERAMYGNGRGWGHDSVGVSEPAKDWYLAEGCTGSGFETWVLVQNPGSTPAKVQITYMTPEGAKPGPSGTLPAHSRKTYNVADTVPGVFEVSTKVHSNKNVVAERAMYGDVK